ncbi:ABC transporter substrate-binding protein [Xanthobacter autotrophicus]|uniref:ABC transporter substrate-binding protein n=1 Tax=Xanthobacter autotrophicus TaxID=280 RepID=UPI00372849AA
MTSLFQRLLAGIIAATLAIGVAAPAAAENRKVVLSQLFQSVMFLPVYVAIDKGFFAQEGLDVRKDTSGSPNASLSAVIARSADFSLHGPEWTAIAASKGAPVQIVAGVVNRAAVWIAARPDIDYKDPASFSGKTVATGMMPIASTSLFTKLLRESGVDPAKEHIQVMQVQAGSELGPLLAGKADVAVLYEPALDQVAAKGMKVIHSFPAQYGPYLLSAITTRRDADPDMVQRFVTGLQHALAFMRANPKAATEVAKAQFPSIEPAVIESAVRRMLDEQVYPASVEISPAALKIAMETQISLGNLNAQPDFETFVGARFIAGALAAN